MQSVHSVQKSSSAPSQMDTPALAAGIKELVSEYAQVRNIYQAAIQVMNVRLETLNAEFSAKHRHNPIHSMCSRVKTPQSIVRKLRERGIQISFDNAKKVLRDIAGVRAICCYVEDIYALADLLKQQDDLQLIEEKDYILKPKANGYRSLHLIVSVPIFLANEKRQMKVEIQLRTIAMDFWASLDHQLRYKKDRAFTPQMAVELYECAQMSALLDRRMDALRQQTETQEEER